MDTKLSKLPHKDLQSLYGTLARCGSFDNNASLKPLFIDERLSAWREKVPDTARNKDERIRAVVAELIRQYDDEGQNGVVLLLQVLASRIKEGDSCLEELTTLAKELAKLLNWSTVAEVGEDEYISRQVQYNEKVIKLYNKMFVFGQAEPRLLDDIFTEVYILPKPTLFRRFRLEGLQEQFLAQPRDLPLRYDERIAADELIKAVDKLFVLGKPGAGKTTFCKHLAVREAQEKGVVNKVPIFITLKQYADTGMSLLEFINEQFDVYDFPNSASFVEALLRGGKALVLFDGLDEVTKDDAGRNRVAAEINQFSRKYDNCHIVVTCRVAATDYSFEQFHYVEMAEFAPEQVETFVRQWFLQGEENVDKADKMLAELNTHEEISDLTRNPLLLALLCLNYDETMSFPVRRVEIYQEALETLFKKWDKSRGILRESAYSSLSTGRKQGVLAELAYDTYVAKEYFFKRWEIESRLADYVASVPETPDRIDIDGEVILQEIIAQHGLLAYQATDIISFSHKTFHEYFTARQIVDNQEASAFEELLNHYVDDSWKEVLILTASLLRKGATSHFFTLFFEKLQRDVRQYPAASGWLARVAKAAMSNSDYHPVATRAYFLNVQSRTRNLFFNIDFNIDLHLDLDHTLNLTRTHVFELSRNLERLRTLARDRLRAHTRAQARSSVRKRARNLIRTLDHAINLAAKLELKVLTSALAKFNIPRAGASHRTWQAIADTLQIVLDTHRPLDSFRELQKDSKQLSKNMRYYKLTRSDIEALVTFIGGSNQLYQCLQVSHLPKAELTRFEHQLLLPPP